MGLDKKVKLTPLMKQYNQIKVKYPDALLLFRVGDFYETFGKDAIKASKILGIILTKKGAGSMSEIELAGFPYHSINNYLPKLVKAGCRVAICDQLENPKLTKKLVKRGVTELVTPGVAINDDVLEHNKNNYLSAITFGKKKSGISFMDISTGDFSFFSGSISQIKLIIEKYEPAEIIISKLSKDEFLSNFGADLTTFFQEDWVFDYENSHDSLIELFETKSLKGFGVEDDDREGIIAAGVVLHYLSETQHNKLAHIKSLKKINSENYLSLDRFTTRNLELNYSANGGVSLIEVIDFTSTSPRLTVTKTLTLQPGAIPNKTIKKITEDIETLSLNTAISTFMISINDLIKLRSTSKKVFEDLLVLMSPFAPHFCEELWSILGHKKSITKAPWPRFQEKYTKDTNYQYPVSFNGKMRFKIELPLSLNKEEIEKEVLKSSKTQNYLKEKTPKKIIVVPGKIVNIVV